MVTEEMKFANTFIGLFLVCLFGYFATLGMVPPYLSYAIIFASIIFCLLAIFLYLKNPKKRNRKSQ